MLQSTAASPTPRTAAELFSPLRLATHPFYPCPAQSQAFKPPGCSPPSRPTTADGRCLGPLMRSMQGATTWAGACPHTPRANGVLGMGEGGGEVMDIGLNSVRGWTQLCDCKCRE